VPLATINPATEETVFRVDPLTDAELNAKLQLAATAALWHRATGFDDRAAKMRRAADLFEAEADRLAELMTLEMGKPLSQAREEALKCATGCRYYAEHAEALLADEPVPNATGACHVRYEPLGVVLALMPWNYPLWQVIRFAAPALMAGNVGLLKHADNVPQCGAALEDIFYRAGFAAGCFQNLAIEIPTIERVIEDPRVAAVSLTGSVAAGRAVGAQAGRALKPCVLELGGNDPFIVLPSASLELALTQAVKARVQNNGQSCIAGKRFFVHAAIYDEFEQKFAAAFRSLKMGNPRLPGTDIGPLAHARAVETLERQVNAALKGGARALVGGKRAPGRGYYFEPTILVDVADDNPVADEEIFGPVAMLSRVASLDEAMARANRSSFGLGASVWTNDPAEQAWAVRGLQAGQVFVNCMVVSQPALPFGGTKQSGVGRELGAPGIRAFTNQKSVRVAT
jgi:succinate-semialdehyde dehydrogenase/glutarate-semialdehyde dehydrogenase